jgi:3'-phosphoadenosine 5'-phosphosulfate sulfotransferase (PAPS reductase)/FAD synthetase
VASLQLPADVESWPAQRVVEYVLAEFPGRVALACSFQKEETVLLDMLFELEPKVRVFAIDTHHLFPETYAYWRAVESHGTKIETFAETRSRRSLGVESRSLPRDAKIEPLNRAARSRRLITGIAATSRRAGRCAEARLGRKHEL